MMRIAYIRLKLNPMNSNKIILVEVFSYVVLYVLIYTLAPRLNAPSGGDAAGNGMAKGLLMLSIIAVFFFIAIALTVTNYFVLKGVTSPGIRFLAFVPLLVSLTHVVYTIFFT
jgi:hypothetical protein